MERGHRWLEHTADIALETWAPDEAALLEEAAQALIAQMTDQAPLRADAERVIELVALDAEDRLVRWLNEVLWLALSEGFLTTAATIRLTDVALHARVSGEQQARGKVVSELKSVTYHAVSLARNAQGLYVGRVVIDV